MTRTTKTRRRRLLLSILCAGLGISVAVHGQEPPRGKPDVPDGRVEFGGEGAPLPQLPQGTPPGGQPGKDSSIANALKDWFKEPGDGSVPPAEGDADEPGIAQPGPGPAGGDPLGTGVGEGGEPGLDGEFGEEGKDNLFSKFVRLFQGKDEGELQDGMEDENYRRIKELERLATRDFKKERYPEVKRNLNDLITLKPYDPGYHFGLGLVFRKEQRYDDAQKKYQDVLDLGGPKPLVHLLMAEALAQTGDTEKVFEHLREAAVGGRNIIHDVGSLSLLSDFRADTEFIKLALSLEKYELSTKKSQDPMTQEFTRRQGPGLSTPFIQSNQDDLADEVLSPEEQQRLLSDARKAYDRVLWFIKLEDEDKAMENYVELRRFLEAQERVTIPKIANDFRLLTSRMDQLEAQIEGIRLKFYYNQALVQLKRMRDAFQEGEYGRVRGTHEEIKKLAKEMERTNVRFKPVAERVLTASTVWIKRTEIREEFNFNKPTVQGIIISPGTKKAIINNRIYRQGEEFGQFLVQKVENNRITFRYKGEEIPLVFRRY